MATEIEKKYRLTKEQRDAVCRRLSEVGTLRAQEFEVNTLYAGNNLDLTRVVLRLRRVEGKTTLTYKERYLSESGVKQNREDETIVADADAMATILEGLGYSPSLIYEKRRATWDVGEAEVVVDELPFGWFVEIEATKETIRATEELLNLSTVQYEDDTYPDLTVRNGMRNGNMIEARFA